MDKNIVTLDEYKKFISMEGKKQDPELKTYLDAANAQAIRFLDWEDDDLLPEWPADIKLAVMRIAQSNYKQEYRRSISAGGMAVDYTPMQGGMPKDAYDMLMPYRYMSIV